jgi:hypothetical protein
VESVCRPTHEDKVSTCIEKASQHPEEEMRMHSSMLDTNAIFFSTNGPSCAAGVSHGKQPFDGFDPLSKNGRRHIYRCSQTPCSTRFRKAPATVDVPEIVLRREESRAICYGGLRH